MLKEVKRRYWIFAICVVFLISFFILLEENISAPFSKCIDNWQANYGPNEPDQYGFFLAKIVGGHALCTVRAVDRHNGFFAAMGAFIVAWFTFSLRDSTDRLWKAGERQ